MEGDWLEADRLVVACEAHSASALLPSVDARLAELLGTVPYSSSMTVALGFDAAGFQPRPDGHGFLVPKKERGRLLGCTWVGTKFPYRVPEDKIVARCFLGGMEDAGVLAESDDAIVATVTSELREIAGVTAAPRFSRVFRWPRSMAQYPVRRSRPFFGGQCLPGHRHPRLHPHGTPGGLKDALPKLKAWESGPKEGREALLREMAVVGQRLDDPFFAHRVHGNAIGQAVALVGPRAVEFQARKKGLPALWNNICLSDRTAGFSIRLATLAPALARTLGRAPAKKARYSASTSSVVRMVSGAIERLRTNARSWAASSVLVRAAQ
jgi:hypothetical protein